ncbi:zinc ribbon domain-containing protein, partial [Streptomyces chiangmaiensis]|uniref:zinc ribbon domain-containing protein n=1 Tax=Streptomyces chiangmaiensis TaxID=766497 RepID=UPI003CD063B2
GRPCQCASSTIRAPRPTARGCTASSARRWRPGVAVEDFRPKFLAKTTMARKAADAAIAATKAALVEMGRKHARDVRLVHPAHTTMDCATCGARTKHALPLSMRTYACTMCGTVSPRDNNSARVMLVRAGWNPDGAEGVRPSGLPAQTAAWSEKESRSGWCL